MASRDPSPWELAMLSGGFPDPWQVWYGGEYPSRPVTNALALSGWRCPGCQRCLSPSVRECPHCQPEPQMAGVSQRLGPDDPMSDDEYER